MMSGDGALVGAIDQGTSSSRFLVRVWLKFLYTAMIGSLAARLLLTVQAQKGLGFQLSLMHT